MFPGLVILEDLGVECVLRAEDTARDLLSLAAPPSTATTSVVVSARIVAAVVAGCSSVAVAAQTMITASADPGIGTVGERNGMGG